MPWTPEMVQPDAASSEKTKSDAEAKRVAEASANADAEAKRVAEATDALTGGSPARGVDR
jgi:membrane protein involved in colicin uptake